MFEQLSALRLIPNELEYFELKIDHYIEWITQDNPNSLLKNKEMTELDLEILFFRHRRQDLIQVCDQLTSHRLFQFKQESIALKQTKPPVSSIGAPYQVESREQRWLDREMKQLEAERDHEVNVVRSRCTTLIQQCEQRIAQAELQLHEAYERYQRNQLPSEFAS